MKLYTLSITGLCCKMLFKAHISVYMHLKYYTEKCNKEKMLLNYVVTRFYRNFSEFIIRINWMF